MTMFKLHRWLLDSANPHGEGVNIGKLLVGISTIIFVVVLISGVVIWWPRARKSLKHSLSISVTHGGNLFWRGLHVAGGMYALVLVLAMALTGLTWSFEWYRNAFYAVCGVENTPRNVGQQPPKRDGGKNKDRADDADSDKAPLSEYKYWQKVYDELKSQNQDSPQITVSNGNASVSLGNYGNVRAADRYEFNPQNGEVTLLSTYADGNKTDKVRGWISAIHMGTFGGIVTRILWLLAALLGASLPLTGYYIWLKHPGKKKKPIKKA